MIVHCGDYSKSMELLSLKNRLEKGISDAMELKEVNERIKVLEKELMLD